MKSLAVRNGDLYFDGNELAMVADQEEMNQSTELGLKMNKGEWFLDLDEGVDYQLIFDKMVSEDRKREEIYNRLISDSRIRSVEEIHFDFNKSTRILKITFKATSNQDQPMEGEVKFDA